MFLKRGKQEGPTKVGEHYVGSQVSSHKLITTETALLSLLWRLWLLWILLLIVKSLKMLWWCIKLTTKRTILKEVHNRTNSTDSNKFFSIFNYINIFNEGCLKYIKDGLPHCFRVPPSILAEQPRIKKVEDIVELSFAHYWKTFSAPIWLISTLL